MRQIFLRDDSLGANQFQYLALAKSFVHPRHALSRASASSIARATAAGPVPPTTSRDFIPSAGCSSFAISVVNSGANAANSAADQSDGFFACFTLSSTSLPTIWCAL